MMPPRDCPHAHKGESMKSNQDDRIAALPDKEHDRVISLRRELSKSFKDVKLNLKYLGMVNGLLDRALSHDGRMAFYSWAFGREIHSSKELSVIEAFAIVLWARPQKSEYIDAGWRYSDTCMSDMPILVKVFSGGVGQMELSIQNETNKEKEKRLKRELGY